MATHERTRLAEIFELARQIAAELAPLTHSASDAQSLSLRLAQAHALGLVDQLAEIVSPPVSVTPGLPQSLNIAHGDEELLNPH